MYRPRRKPSPAFATRIMGRRLATRAAITLRGTLAAISSLAFSLACSVSLCGLWRAAAKLSYRLTVVAILAASTTAKRGKGRHLAAFSCLALLRASGPKTSRRYGSGGRNFQPPAELTWRCSLSMPPCLFWRSGTARVARIGCTICRRLCFAARRRACRARLCDAEGRGIFRKLHQAHAW